MDDLQRIRTKRAIRWLLSKVPQSIDEIAEHFEISPQLVEELIKELLRARRIVKETRPGTPIFYKSSK